MSKSILITGCSSGIGLAAAHGLRAQGWRVFASCRQQRDCDRLRAQGFESPRIDYVDPRSRRQVHLSAIEYCTCQSGRLYSQLADLVAQDSNGGNKYLNAACQ